jgi:CRISPR-associated protein Cmr4
MITATKTLYLYVETPLHAGVGSGLSSVDLPIQRERTTQYPLIQGSGIKGKLRALATDTPALAGLVTSIFGPEENGAEHAGALIAGDAHILLFPVRSLSGVFAYVTSPEVLERFKRACSRELTSQIAQQSISWDVPTPSRQDSDSTALVTTKSQVRANNTVVLEEFSFQAEASPQVDTIADWIATHALPATDIYTYWRNKLKSSLVILPNDDFRDFVRYATEIITRIRLNRETKTVATSALWTEEYLPSDTLFYVPIYATDSRKADHKLAAAEILSKLLELEKTQGGYIQLGGNETVGRGMVRMHWELETTPATSAH